MVKAANSDGKWNTIPTVLEIIVLPIWYKTWWAILLFLATFIGFITFVFRFFWMRKSMEAELEIERRDKEHQEEINQMKMRFFINISHELRTPLTLILAPLQDIINKISDRWTRNQLEYIQRNANRLLHLVNQLMDYRRAELGVFELKAKKANAYQLIQENFLFYDKLARHKKITYTLHSVLEDKEVLFDPNYLELIVNNLLSNAFKYTESGQSITVTLKEENNWLVLQVSDTGIGIPINKQGKIFERFYQIESEHVGSGIGLSLVQRLVELHHGRIELDCEEGKGSTFSVYLPQDINIYKSSELASNDAKNEEDQVYSTNSKEMYFIDTEKVENETIETGDKKRGTILIVEDNNEIRHYLSSGLAELFNTLEAGNGEEALEKLKEVGMLEWKDSYPSQISGGQQQRLCIARAMAVSPSVLLMDEPASALDPISTAKVEELIHELKKQYTIVIVTHNMQQAARVSDSTAFFYMGEMVEFGDTKKIFTNPDKVETQNYITGRFG